MVARPDPPLMPTSRRRADSTIEPVFPIEVLKEREYPATEQRLLIAYRATPTRVMESRNVPWPPFRRPSLPPAQPVRSNRAEAAAHQAGASSGWRRWPGSDCWIRRLAAAVQQVLSTLNIKGNKSATNSAPLAARIGCGAADLPLSPPRQSRARDLVAGACRARSHAGAAALAQRARNDPAVRFGLPAFCAGAAHDLRAPPLGAAAHRMDPPLGGTQPPSTAHPPCGGDPTRRLALWLRAEL